MNSIFQVANTYLHYRGGKHVGLAGIVGVIVTIYIIVIWSDWIQPVVNFIGLDKVVESVGITVEGVGGPAITAYNVFILYLFGCLAFSMIVGISLLIYVFGSVALRSKFGGVLVGVLIFIPLSPMLIWIVVAKSRKISKQQKSALAKSDKSQTPPPLKKQNELMDYLIHTEEKEGESNEVSKEDAIRYLHRLPSTKEYRYLIGITNNKEIVLLFPRPFNVIVYGTNHRLLGITLSFRKFIPMQDDPYGVNGATNPHRFFMKTEEELNQWEIEEIETFLYAKTIYDIDRIINDFPTSRFYRNYVDMVIAHYRMNKDKDHEDNKIAEGILFGDSSSEK
ncbi:hypothetical protein [Oceanobacillus kimchii]|uniref:hypothetical protein n=1 Tax=Oceanobacillus kimchii TaxID=746691 RepID=UPI003B01E966